MQLPINPAAPVTTIIYGGLFYTFVFLQIYQLFMMNSRFFKWTLICLFTIVGCQSPKEQKATSNGSLNAIDDLGRKVSCPSNVQRVMALSPSLTEYLALICPDKIVARTQNCDFPVWVKDLPAVSNYPELDVEALVRLRVDLIVSQKGITNSEQIKQIEELGIPVYIFNNDSISKMIHANERLGTLVGDYNRGKEVADSLQKQLDCKKDTSLAQVKVLGITSLDPIFIYGRSSLFGQMVDTLGATCFGESLSGSYPQVDEEYLIRKAPSLIVAPAGFDYEAFFDVHTNLKNLEAYQQNRLYMINGDYISRQGPRALLGLQELKRILEKF
ncbi:helical backbone metal receptor [Cyclobacteriaceae bacterium]|nr:helical backbone metal receptor [Cyclobacteriaceae bacterium]